MALIDQYNLANDAALRARVTSALTNAFDAIETEPSTTTNHTARLQWVNSMKANPGPLVTDLCWGCASDSAILTAYADATPPASSAVQDADIQRVVSALITANVGV